MGWKVSGTIHKHVPPGSGGQVTYTGVRKKYTADGDVVEEQLISTDNKDYLSENNTSTALIDWAISNGHAQKLEGRDNGTTWYGAQKEMDEDKKYSGMSKGAHYKKAMEHKEFAQVYLKGNKFYDAYGKGKGDLRDLSNEELQEIRAGDEWEEFLEFGLGVRRDKIESTWGDEGTIGTEEMPNLKAEDLQDWATGKESGYTFGSGEDDYGVKLTEGSTIDDDTPEGEDPFEYRELEGETSGVFSEAEDARFDYIDDLDVDGATKDALTMQLKNIRSEEASAREDYRDKVEGTGGYSDILDELLTEFGEDTTALGIDKETALKDLLEGYKAGAGEQREVYTEDIGQLTEQERALQAQTGLTREQQSISDLTKEYIPDFESKIKEHQVATGATTEDIITQFSDKKSQWEKDVHGQETEAQSAWETLMGSLGGTAPGLTGQNILDSLLLDPEGGYYSRLKESLGTDDSGIPFSQRYGWMQ